MTWYLGASRAGKTTLAAQELMADIAANGWPGLILDSAETEVLDHFERVGNIEKLVRRVWRGHLTTALVPRNLEDVERACRAALAGGCCHVLVDEAGWWLDAGTRRSPLLRLIRAGRHAGVSLRLTTHHLSGDVPQAALAQGPELVLFRVSAPASLRRLRELGMPDEHCQRLRRLPDRHYVRLRL